MTSRGSTCALFGEQGERVLCLCTQQGRLWEGSQCDHCRHLPTAGPQSQCSEPTGRSATRGACRDATPGALAPARHTLTLRTSSSQLGPANENGMHRIGPQTTRACFIENAAMFSLGLGSKAPAGRWGVGEPQPGPARERRQVTWMPVAGTGGATLSPNWDRPQLEGRAGSGQSLRCSQ